MKIPVVVTGGSRGLGLAIVEALAAAGAQVTVVARDEARLAAIARPGVATRRGDATDPEVIDAVVREVRPAVLILNAGATPAMGPIDEQSWETYSRIWQTDVKASFHGVQAALRTPMAPGGRVLLVSSGAARVGAPLSGGYAGAKRELWFMAHYANEVAERRGLGLRFQVLVPMQLYTETPLAEEVAGAYARRQGVSIEAFVKGRYGELCSARDYGAYVATLLGDPRYAAGVAYGIRGGSGITSLDDEGGR